MAGEIKVNVGLSVIVPSGNSFRINKRYSHAFQLNMTEINGPCVGVVTVTKLGKDIDLSELISPGVCWLHNLSDLWVVDIGTRDPSLAPTSFRPMIELPPMTSWPIPISRHLGQEYSTGTGTAAGFNTVLHARLTDEAAPVGAAVDVEFSIYGR